MTRNVRIQKLAKGVVILSIAVFAVPSGCQEGYTVPGHGADLRAFGVQRAPLDLADSTESSPQAPARPEASFPSTIAAVRVQGGDYRTRSARLYSAGAYTIVATRDVEMDKAFQTLAADPMIRAIVPLNHLILPNCIRGAADLCQAAQRMGGDMVLIYTLDSAGEMVHHVPELSVVTLGLLPEGEAVARCTASAILLDARSGYVYAISEGSDQQQRLTSAWGGDSAHDKARQSAEKHAFHKLLADLDARWKQVVLEYATP